MFWDDLEAGGERVALFAERESLSYLQLAERVEHFTCELRGQVPEHLARPLVLLEATNDVASIVAYLACLRARFPVILTGEGQADAPGGIASTYRPNVVLRRAGMSLESAEPAAMHPDLALLLSTSGTTGAAKLVRLSADNLEANARAISAYLNLSPADRAITALPFHYSYGMSVVHTHLRAHAGLVLTTASLVDDEFWVEARGHSVTSLALVPTQFELLDKLGFCRARHLPTLRYVTQAGGKLDPKLAAHFADRADAEGYRLFIMYGQTEASPRMSYVPSEDARLWHHSIGRPIDGGKLRILDAMGEEIEGAGVPGELVFEGPNVMLGYALTRADLGAPAGPPILKTGDIAERLPNGYFRIVGRTSRFIKLFGLRVSLDEVESRLRSEGHRAYVTGSDEKLVVFLLDAARCSELRAEIARRHQWPERMVQVVPLESAPLLPSGKVDYRELSRRAAALVDQGAEVPDLEALLRSALRTASLDPDKSFVEHGGDSLAYLEVQLFLSQRVGNVPENWECLALRELFLLERPELVARRAWQRVPAELIGRNVAIMAVIALHSTGWKTGGGSILLLMLVGYSLARFQGELLFTGRIGRTLRSMLGPIVALYFVFIAIAALKFSPFDHGWFLLVQNFRQDVNPDFLLPYWFVNAYAQIVTLVSLPFALPSVRAIVKRAPFEVGLLALLGVGLVVQLTELSDMAYYLRHRHPVVGLELVLCGWCMFFARTTQKKIVATAAILLVWLQNYGLVEGNIAVLMLGGSLCTLWGLQVSIPRDAARALLSFGSLSMFVYLAHVPALYGLSRFVDAGALRFLGALFASLAFALVLKKASDLVVYRWVR